MRGEHERGEAADDASDAGHRTEVADPRLAEVEHAQRDRNLEHQARAGHDRLCEEERYQQAQIPVGEDRTEALRRLGDEALLLLRLLLQLVVRAQPDDERGRPEERRRVEEDHRLTVREREQQPGERGTGEEPDALDRARRDVGGRQLGGIARATAATRPAPDGTRSRARQ